MTARTFITETANAIDVMAAVASTSACVFGSILIPQQSPLAVSPPEGVQGNPPFE